MTDKHTPRCYDHSADALVCRVLAGEEIGLARAHDVRAAYEAEWENGLTLAAENARLREALGACERYLHVECLDVDPARVEIAYARVSRIIRAALEGRE